MGDVIVSGPCSGCGLPFSYNPMRVPSCSAVTGEREPICRQCVEPDQSRADQQRAAADCAAARRLRSM